MTLFKTLWQNIQWFVFEHAPRFYTWYSSVPVFIKIACFFIAFTILVTLITYVGIVSKRFGGYMAYKRLHQYDDLIDNLITENVVLNNDLQKSIPAQEARLNSTVFIQQLPLHKKWARQKLVDKILHFKKMFTGETGLLLRRLFIELELEKEGFSKLRSLFWERKIKGLMELSRMEIEVPDTTLLPLTNSHNRLIRMEARSCYVRLSKNEPYKFFDIARDPLQTWDQIDLFRIISLNKNSNIPNFSTWISYSENKSIVSFCLKLTVLFNQEDAYPSIMTLLDNKDHTLRAEAINTLGKLQADECEQRLVDMYNQQPHNCQVEILKALGRTASGKHLNFLIRQFEVSSDFDIRKNAAKSIINHKTKAKAIIDDLLASHQGMQKKMLLHCLNPIIKY